MSGKSGKSFSEDMVSTILCFIKNILNLEDGNDRDQDTILLHYFFYRVLIYSSQVSKIWFNFIGKIRGKTLHDLGSVS